MPTDPKQRYLIAALAVGLLFLPPLALAAMQGATLLLYVELARNVFEAAVKLLSLIAARRVARGETTEYAYGQGKLEHLMGVLVAGVMLFSVGVIATHALGLALTPKPAGDLGLGLATAGGMAVANLVFWRCGISLAKATNSPLIESKWRMYRGRTLASLLVVASLGATSLLGTHDLSRVVDPAASLLLCLFILNSARGVLRQALSGLLDKSLDESLQLLIIRELTRSFHAYEAIHGIRNRRSGSDVFIEIFLEFDGAKTMAVVQADIDAMRAALELAIPGSRVAIVPSTRRVN